MSPVRIEGKERPINEIFSSQYVFTIPRYQRPYSWTTEQARELLEDLLTAMGDDTSDIEGLEPYFLGSIVLAKEEHTPEAESLTASSGWQRSSSCSRWSGPSRPTTDVLCLSSSAFMNLPTRSWVRRAGTA